MATEKDLLAKYITLDDSIGAYLVLDRTSEDPIVQSYLSDDYHDFRALLEEWEYGVFRIQGDRWVYAEVSQIQPEAWVDMIAIPNEKQQLWSDRIDWTWHDHDIVAVCREWSLLPYHGPKES